MKVMPRLGVSLLVCLAVVGCVTSSDAGVVWEKRAANEAVEANLLKGFAVSGDRNYPNYLRSTWTIFNVDRDKDVSISHNSYVTLDMQYSDSENTAAKNVAVEVGVKGHYGAFSAAATMKVSSSSSSSYKTVRIDSVAKATKYRVASKGAFRSNPAQFLTQTFKDTVKTHSLAELEKDHGIFYAVALNLGGQVKKSYIMEAMATDTETSVFAEIQAKYGSAGMGVTGKMSYSNEQRSSNKKSTVKQQWKANGGEPNIWLKGSFNAQSEAGALDALVKEWAGSINDDNLYPSDFELRPMWELVMAVDQAKGEQFKTYLENKWADQLKQFVPTRFRSGYADIDTIPLHYAMGSSYYGSSSEISQKNKVMDGDPYSTFHTECDGTYQWIAVIFKSPCWVTSVRVVNGKRNGLSDRIDEATVYVKEGNKEVVCGRIHTSSGTTVAAQTYTIKCQRPIFGVGVVVYNADETCTELAELSAEGYCGMGDCYLGADIPRMHDYRGTVSTTVSGRRCQKWSEQSPHKHTRTAQNYPNTGVDGGHNFCRDPDNAGYPWCYTTDPDPKYRYERCPVKKCEKLSACYSGTQDAKRDYRGTVNQDENGTTCVNWPEDTWTLISKGIYPDHNFCRGEDSVWGPWCYTSANKGSWGRCVINEC